MKKLDFSQMEVLNGGQALVSYQGDFLMLDDNARRGCGWLGAAFLASSVLTVVSVGSGAGIILSGASIALTVLTNR